MRIAEEEEHVSAITMSKQIFVRVASAEVLVEPTSPSSAPETLRDESKIAASRGREGERCEKKNYAHISQQKAGNKMRAENKMKHGSFRSAERGRGAGVSLYFLLLLHLAQYSQRRRISNCYHLLIHSCVYTSFGADTI